MKNKILRVYKKESNIDDYRITWRFCSYYNNTKHIIEKIPQLINEQVCSFAFDSDMNFYKIENNKLVLKHFKLECEHGNPNGEIIFDEDYKLNEQEEHYLFEISGTLIFRNMMFDDLDNTKTIYMILEPIYITYDNCYLQIYPLIKIRHKMIMIEYRVYPDDRSLTSKEFIDTYADLQRKKINIIQLDINLYKAIIDNQLPDDIVEMEHDNIHHRVCTVQQGKFQYLKDIALELIFYLTDIDNIDWIGRTTYSLPKQVNENNLLNPLLLSFSDKSLYLSENTTLHNYREFDDYKHYVTIGVSITIGDIYDTYIFADTLDEEILFLITNVYKMKKQIQMYKNNEKILLDTYEAIISFKADFLNKYNHIASVRSIMNYIWDEMKVQDLIDQLKDLIELCLKRADSEKNKQINKIQLYFSIIAVLLSSSPIFEYIVLPTVCDILKINLNLIGTYFKILLYLSSVATTFLILWFIKYVIERFNKLK